MQKKHYLFVFGILFNVILIAQTNYNMQFRSHTEFPEQTLANICGYAKDGREYALLGASKGMIIMDVTNPDAPIELIQIPGPDNLWKEIKVYQHYAYVTSEGGGGLQIVDMSQLPNKNAIPYKSYTGDGALTNLGRIHALHIDVPKGVVYCFGATGTLTDGAIMLDIKTDPWNPRYLGVVNKDYIHDGFAENDTLYAGHIYRGDMEIWYTGNKSNPVSLGRIKTPTAFTHNVWLSNNHKYAFTTDENNNSFLGAYDVTDPSDIKFLDKISHNIGSGAVIHNTHILNDYAVSSYYTEGVTIHDVHRPDNLVEVAHYDTYNLPINPNAPFEGAWGVYPFLPSGNLIISNIDEGLYILSPTYKRACYIEGKIKDKVTKDGINGASLSITSVATADATSDLLGVYKTGVANAGTYTLAVSKPGYIPTTVSATVAHGEVTILDIELQPLDTYILGVEVVDENNNPIEGAIVSVLSNSQTLNKKTDNDGKVTFVSYKDTITVYAGKWGYHIASLGTKELGANSDAKVALKKGYRDDFISGLPFNWQKSGTATAGEWVLGNPKATFYNNSPATPSADDATDLGNECYLTGNLEGQPGSSDVDNGYVLLTSPAMDFTTFKNPIIKFDRWFFNGGGGGNPPPAINDSMKVIVSNGTMNKIIYIAQGINMNKWAKMSIALNNIIPLTNNMTISFRVADADPGHLVKAAIDLFEVEEGTVGVQSWIDENLKLNAMPNPSQHGFSITYDIPTLGEFLLTNSQGQILLKMPLSANTGNFNIGESLPNGVYFVQIQSGSSLSKPLRLIKVN
jgi:choice-of-anchor B domain-containing protein